MKVKKKLKILLNCPYHLACHENFKMGSAIFVALKMAELYANVSSKNLYCN
jgi:hypothetical protein